MIGVCGCDLRPNLGEWDVQCIFMNGSRELDILVYVIRDVNVLGPTNVDMFGPTVSVPSSVVVDAATVDVEVVAEHEEWPIPVPHP